MNGNSQNGNDDWGNDWGSDWSQAEAYNNNNYGKGEQQYSQQQQYQTQQHQQYYQGQQQQQQHHHHTQVQQNYQHEANQKNVQQHYEQQQQNLQHSQQFQAEHQAYYQHQQQHYMQDNKSVQQQPVEDVQQQPVVEQYHQQQQQQHGQLETPQTSESDAWGWGNDDSAVSNQEREENLAYEYGQQAAPESSAPSDGSTVASAAVPQKEPETSHGDDHFRANKEKDVAGDGWPGQGSEAQQPQGIQHATEQRSQFTEQPPPSVNENERIPSSHHLEGQQQEGYHYDDGLGRGEKSVVDTTAATTYNALPDHPTVAPDSGQFLVTYSNDPSHPRQDSWGWGGSDTEVRPEDNASSGHVTESITAPDAGGSSTNQSYYNEDQMMPIEQTPSTDKNATVTTEETPKMSTDAPVTESGGHGSNSATSGPVVSETWDDDGWGDGWEADGSAVQEMASTEEKTQEQFYHQDPHPPHQHLPQPPVDLGSEHSDTFHGSGVSAASQADSSSDLHQSYQPSTVVSEANLYAHGHSEVHPQTLTQQGESAWESSWNPNVAVDSSNIDAPSLDAVECITQEISAMSLTQQKEENASSALSSATYDQHHHSETGENTLHSQPSHHHLDYHSAQSEQYPHVPQGEMQAPPSWQPNPSAQIQEAASQPHFQWTPADNLQSSKPEDQRDGLLVGQNQNVHAEMAPSPHPLPVPSPHRDTDHYSQPMPVPSPNPPASEGVPLEDPSHRPPPSLHPQNLPLTYHQFQDLNQEVIEEPRHTHAEVPDPMLSRIPDGASSVSEIPMSAPG